MINEKLDINKGETTMRNGRLQIIFDRVPENRASAL